MKMHNKIILNLRFRMKKIIDLALVFEDYQLLRSGQLVHHSVLSSKVCRLKRGKRIKNTEEALMPSQLPFFTHSSPTLSYYFSVTTRKERRNHHVSLHIPLLLDTISSEDFRKTHALAHDLHCWHLSKEPSHSASISIRWISSTQEHLGYSLQRQKSLYSNEQNLLLKTFTSIPMKWWCIKSSQHSST